MTSGAQYRFIFGVTRNDYMIRIHCRVSKGDRVIIPILALNVLKEIWGEDAYEFKFVH